MRRAFSQRKAIRNDDEGTVRTRMADPSEILIILHFSFYKLAVGPVTHPGKRALALYDRLHSLVPAQSRVIGILVPQHFPVSLGCLLNFGVVPSHLPAEKIRPTLRSHCSEQRVFT